MSKGLCDFTDVECSACHRKSIDIRTEVLIPTAQTRRDNRIVKRIILRCEIHLHCDVEEMERLASIKGKASKETKHGK